MRKATRQPATFGKEKRPQAHLGDGEDFLNGTLRKRRVIFIIGNSWVGRLFGYLFPVCFFGVIYLHPFPLYPLLESGARLIFFPFDHLLLRSRLYFHHRRVYEGAERGC